jgi:hypothetical protein
MQSSRRRLLTLPNDESRNDGAADIQRINGNHIPDDEIPDSRRRQLINRRTAQMIKA